MSRPQKIHPPIKASFTDIINAVADGKGIKPETGKSRKEAVRLAANAKQDSAQKQGEKQ